MSIDNDIFQLQGLSARIGSSLVAENLAESLVKEIINSKSVKGPNDDTGTLTKGITAKSATFGSKGNWAIGVGDLNILGRPTDKAPKHTIKDFLAFIRGTYKAAQDRNRRRAEHKRELKLQKERDLISRREESLKIRDANRRERQLKRLTLNPRNVIARAEARIQRFELEIDRIKSNSKANTRTAQNLASQRSKLVKRINAFYKSYGYKEGSGDVLSEFLFRYTSVSGKGGDVIGQVEAKEIGTKLNKRSKRVPKQYTAAKRIRKSVRAFIKKSRGFSNTQTQVNTVRDRINEAREKINEANSEISSIRKR